MPHYQRCRIPGGCYFFTVVTHDRQPLLKQHDVRLALRQAIQRVRSQQPFRIDGWVLLPDHLHCIWTLPPGDADYSGRWRHIKSLVTQACGARYFRPEELSLRRAHKGQGTLWQQRFWEHGIRDESDLQRHLDYLHWNPVKHGLVSRVADWPWSSFHRQVRLGFYPPDWGYDPALPKLEISGE